MADLNALIAQGAQFRIPPPVDPMANMPQLMQMRAAQNQNALAQYQLSSAQREDAATNALREKYRARAESAQRKVAAAEDKLSRARAQHSDSQVNQTLELGSSVLGALFGRRSAVRGAVAAAKRAQRTSRKGDDVERTQALLETARGALAALEREVQLRLQELAAEYDPARLVIEEKQVTAKKADLRVERLALAWAPR